MAGHDAAKMNRRELIGAMGAAAAAMACVAGEATEDFGDASIVTRVRTALLNDIVIGRRKIEVTVLRGVVTLTGAVANESEMKQAADIARRVPDVVDVIVRLHVQPDLDTRPGSQRSV